MAKLILGLDISGERWRCVVASRGFKEKVRIESFVTFPPLPFPPGDLLDDSHEDPHAEEAILEWAEGTKRVLDQYFEGGGDVVVGVPLDSVSLRVLDLPFSQPSKIARVLPFEAESSLPFDSEDMLFDFYSVGSADGGSRVLSAAMKRDQVAALLDHLKLLDLDPVILVPTTMALHHLEGFSPVISDGSPVRTTYLNIGKESSRLAVAEGPKIIFATSIRAGHNGLAGDDEDAAAGSGTDAGDLAGALTPSLRRLFHFLEGYSPGDDGCPPPLKGMVLLGEGASLPGLAEALSDSLGLTVRRFQVSPESMPEDAMAPEESHPELAPALALVIQKASPNGRSGLNFRREEFAFRPERKALIRKAVFPGFLVIALIASIFLRVSLAGSTKSQQVAQIEEEMASVFRANFPEAQVVNPARQLQTMIEDVKAKQLKYEELSYPSAMACLAEVSKAIPDSINVKLSSFEYRNDRVSIAGTTDQLEDPNEITKRLSQTSIFHNVKLENTQQTRDQNFRFKISTSLKQEGGP